MSFVIYDLTFLVIFTILVFVFVYTRKSNVKREGIMYLYRTKLGIKYIDYIGDNFKRTLHFLKYIVVSCGFILMGLIVYLIGKSIYIYLAMPQITEIIKAPPIAPLIPYFPELFGMTSYFPPFYFTYFIIAFMIVAISHEFSHGIYMRLFKIKIKSTGLAILGPILGAFVEQDDKDMKKKKNFEQMTVLAAGTFSNLVLGILFLIIFILYFYAMFIPSGYVFNTYAMSSIPTETITGISDYENNLTLIQVGENNYFLTESMKYQIEENYSEIIVLSDAPAAKSGLKGVIVGIDDYKIVDSEGLSEVLSKYKPGEEVVIKTDIEGEIRYWNLELGTHPENNSKAYIGVATTPQQTSMATMFSPQKPSTYYLPKYDGEFVFFIYHLLFWIMLINIFVAMFNMLPLGILDGGRFFMLAITSITKSEKFAEKLFSIVTYLILFGFALMMFIWFVRII